MIRYSQVVMFSILAGVGVDGEKNVRTHFFQRVLAAMQTSRRFTGGLIRGVVVEEYV